MKNISIFVTAALTLTQVSAHAFEAVANVVGVTPITEQVNRPTQQCWTETQQTTQAVPQQRNFLGALIGGVAGGLLGAQVGRGNGRIAGAAVGAGVGAVAGDGTGQTLAGGGNDPAARQRLACPESAALPAVSGRGLRPPCHES